MKMVDENNDDDDDDGDDDEDEDEDSDNEVEVVTYKGSFLIFCSSYIKKNVKK